MKGLGGHSKVKTGREICEVGRQERNIKKITGYVMKREPGMTGSVRRDEFVRRGGAKEGQKG